MLHQTFTALVSKYTTDDSLTQQLWNDIEAAYSQSERYFHNLSHLEHMEGELTAVKDEVQDWDTLAFSLFYHDIAYDVMQYVVENDNEERSAVLAEKALNAIGFPPKKIHQCSLQILATKKHQPTGDNDTDLFTDADLSILGQPWKNYEVYMKNIRKEYKVFPDPIYHAGRIKVLKYFLQMERLFKTRHFNELYETTARENINRELEFLSLL